MDASESQRKNQKDLRRRVIEPAVTELIEKTACSSGNQGSRAQGHCPRFQIPDEFANRAVLARLTGKMAQWKRRHLAGRLVSEGFHFLTFSSSSELTGFCQNR
jgi:hypothetical protein